jgi:hypothetical protein
MASSGDFPPEICPLVTVRNVEQATVEGEGTVSFYWKVSSEEGDDYLEFYIDDVRKDRISGEVGWEVIYCHRPGQPHAEMALYQGQQRLRRFRLRLGRPRAVDGSTNTGPGKVGHYHLQI